MIDLTDDTVVTEELIALAERHGACSEWLKWLREQPRTWGELKQTAPEHVAWAMTYIPSFPINLSGLGIHVKAWVMVNRRDCSIDLTGMRSEDRAQVMAARPDCQIDLEGLSRDERDRVVGARFL